MTLATQHLFGLDFVSDATIAEVVDALVAEGAEPSSEWRCVVTPNVDHLVRYRRFLLEGGVGENASLVLPDGMPIVWGSRLLGRPLRRRLTGADLFVSLWDRLMEGNVPTVVVAASEDVARILGEGQDNVGCVVPPMFATTDDEAIATIIDEIDARIDEIGARFLVIGVSMPKHHLMASRLRERWSEGREDLPIVLLLGASPNFAVGLARRAPGWMQRYGLEWVHRLIMDPRNMAKRYLIDDMVFLSLIWGEWRKVRQTRRAGP